MIPVRYAVIAAAGIATGCEPRSIREERLDALTTDRCGR
jgi:hypothetical protein